MTSSVPGTKRSSEALLKAKHAPKKKVIVTVWWSAAWLIQYSFLNPSEAIIFKKYAQQISEKTPSVQLALANRKGLILP